MKTKLSVTLKCFMLLALFSGIIFQIKAQNQMPDTTTAEFKIIQAVKNGDVVKFNKLIENNPALLHIKEPTRQEPLLLAAVRSKKVQMVELILDKGTNIHITNSRGNTALHVAASIGSVELVDFLLKKGADYMVKNKQGRTMLEYISYGQNTKIYDLMLQKDKNILAYKSVDGTGLLHWAVTAGDTAGFVYLLKKGLDIKQEDNNGANCMHWALSGGNKNMLRFLKNNGYNLYQVSSKGFSPIASAMYMKNKKSIEFLIEIGFQINQKYPPHGNTLFIEACQTGVTEIINYLLEKGADVNTSDDNGYTALHLATINYNYPLTQMLISKGANINKTTNTGRTPLFMAIERDSVNMVKLLVENGADIQKADFSGLTLLHQACINNNIKVISYLINKGLSVNLKDNEGKTVLHFAAIYGRTEIAKILLKNGADMRITDNQNHTPEFYSLYYGNYDVAQLISQKNMNESNKTYSLNTGLKNGQAIVRYLFHSGYAVETSKHLLIFDYFEYIKSPDKKSLLNGRINPHELKNKKIIVFVSHDHSDHYDSTIWNWKNINPEIQYVLGFQPNVKHKYEYLAPRQSKTIDGVTIFTIKSTDTGVGFLVESDGITIFHPGDHANKSSDLEADFKDEINYLAGMNKKIDVAFFPVAGCGFNDLNAVKTGNLYILDKLSPKKCFSMHAEPIQCVKFSKETAEKYKSQQFYFGTFPGDRFEFVKN